MLRGKRSLKPPLVSVAILVWTCELCFAWGLANGTWAQETPGGGRIDRQTGGENWPQFRGPAGDGTAGNAAPPREWSETTNIAWQTPLPGRGWSSPVVRGDQVWLTTALEELATPAEKKRLLSDNKYEASLALATSVSLRAICIHGITGALIHDIELFRVDSPDPIHKFNSYATPTPVIESARVFCDFGTYGTAAVDTTSGQVIWRRHLPIEHQVGPASSPILAAQLLVLTRDGCDLQYVIGLDKQTGKTIWRTDRPPIDLDPEFRKGFSTPLLIDTPSGQQLVVPGAKWVVSYEPATGREVWRADYIKGYSNAARPVFGHELVFVCTNGPGRQLWALRVDGRGDVTQSHVAWRAQRQISNRASPLLVGDEIYVVTDNGIVTCFDALSGQKHWSQRIGGNHAASPTLAGGHVLVLSEEGLASMFVPGKQPRLVAENKLPGRFIASPAVVGGALYLRSDAELFKIEER